MWGSVPRSGRAGGALVLALAVLAGCSDVVPEPPALGCRWQHAGTFTNTAVELCMMLVVVDNATLGDSCNAAAVECAVLEVGASLDWLSDSYTPGDAEVQPFYVECSEACP